MTEPKLTLDGYVADILYPSLLHRYFQAPWMDAVLAIHGIVPPRFKQDSFTQIDLGCGDGLGLILAASSHPQGTFIGVDGAQGHIDRGQKIIDALDLKNIRLICAGFSEFDEPLSATADYVTAQGVLSWVTEENRQSLLTLSANLLKPGGAFCVGYNAFPGWFEGAPFQALIRAVAAEKSGSSVERFEAAWDQIRNTGLIADRIWEFLERVQKSIPPHYFAHEYLSEGAQPCWSGDVITQMGALGLAYIAQSAHERLREDYCFKPKWREHLDEFDSVPAREIATDIYCQSWFRRDIYIKTPAFAFEPDEAREFRLQSWWKVSDELGPAPELQTKTYAGTLEFDTNTAKAVLNHLASGPQNLESVIQDASMEAKDVLDTIDALFIAKYVTPVDPERADARSSQCNDWLDQHGIKINGRASKHGAIGI